MKILAEALINGAKRESEKAGQSLVCQNR